jgi:hypothetical protein
MLLKDGGGMVDCLPSLYQSIKNLSDTYMDPFKAKGFLLQPKVVMPGAKVPLLLPNVASTLRELYICIGVQTTLPAKTVSIMWKGRLDDLEVHALSTSSIRINVHGFLFNNFSGLGSFKLLYYY